MSFEDTELPEEMDLQEGEINEEKTGKFDKLFGENSRKYKLSKMFREWYIDYSSYTVLYRAVPHLIDGLKPVQRRVLHAMWRMDDGSYTKVANIVGQAMQFHPHGDQSILGALVWLGQRNYLVDCQGNWGNILTGDSNAAPRYIEARLSKFGKEVVFNPKTTNWMTSYDGRNQEPVELPVKFPILLAQGTEGIGAGFASKILPHNFNELIDASICVLQGKDFEIFPDFLTGGSADCSKYSSKRKGGKIKIRAKIEKIDKNTLAITEVPFSKTTPVVIETILKAKESGKIKIKKIDDLTTDKVNIIITLPNDVSPDKTIDALYAFTACEVSITPNTCVILDNKPQVLSVNDMLRYSTEHTRELLGMELSIRLSELENEWHYNSLEKIFFENKVYKILEGDAKTWEDQLQEVFEKMLTYQNLLKRPIVMEDINRLVEKPVRKISKFDVKAVDEKLRGIEDEMAEVQNHLEHLTDYAIRYFQDILKKYGKGRERKTEIRSFEDIESTTVALANEKLYVNYQTGFVGWGLKREEGVEVACECSKLDDIIVFRKDGTMMVTKVQEKGFVGSQECKEILYVSVFRKRDERTVYNLIYRDGPSGYAMVKRFSVTAVTRDRDYLLTKGTKGSKVLYFTANPNGEAEVVTIHHVSNPKLKKVSFDFDFKTLAIKGRQSMGNILTRNAVRSINLKDEGVSTLSARKIWFDESVKRLNVNEAGRYLGEFVGTDKILAIMQGGSYRTTGFDLANHYDDDLVELRKFRPDQPVTALYRSPDGYPYLKRFIPEPTDRKTPFLDDDGSQLIDLCLDFFPRLEVVYTEDSGKKIQSEIIEVEDFIGVKSNKARGKRVTTFAVEKFGWLAPLKADPEPAEPDNTLNAEEMTNNTETDDRQGFAEGTQTQLF